MKKLSIVSEINFIKTKYINFTNLKTYQYSITVMVLIQLSNLLNNTTCDIGFENKDLL